MTPGWSVKTAIQRPEVQSETCRQSPPAESVPHDFGCTNGEGCFFFRGLETLTLQEINISHLGKRKIISKMQFLGDMLVPWRVADIDWRIHHKWYMNPRGCNWRELKGLWSGVYTKSHDALLVEISSIDKYLLPKSLRYYLCSTTYITVPTPENLTYSSLKNDGFGRQVFFLLKNGPSVDGSEIQLTSWGW